MTSHQSRVLTALFLSAILISFLFFAPYYLLAIAVYVLSALCLWEFYSFFLNVPKNWLLKSLGVLLALPVVLFSFLDISPALGILLSFWILAIFYLFVCGPDGKIDWGQLQVLVCGWLYIPLVFQFFLEIAPVEIFLIFLAAIFSDIGGFYFGSWMGKKRMWPGLSPKKTWIGGAGGMFFCIAVCVLLGVQQGSIDWYHWFWIGAGLNIAAQLGDLFESALKRQYRVKDSGRFLPGHGGLLDRFDSVLFVIVAYMILKQFIPMFGY